MATHLQTVNRVLRRLREDTVTGIADNDYSQLIGEFVIEAVEEVNDQHNWESLKHRVVVDITAGTTLYDLSAFVAASGNVRDSSDRVCHIDSELQFTSGSMAQAWVYDSDSDDTNTPAHYITPESLREIDARDRDWTDDEVVYFTVYPKYDGSTEKLYLEIYPETTTNVVIEMMFWTPAPDLNIDGTSDDQEVFLPDRPIFLHALMAALNERGEEIGEPGNVAESRYIRALGAALERDLNAPNRAGRYDWERG